MNRFQIISIKFNNYVREATDELHNNELEKSYKTIINAINLNPNAPEPHNLLGIWYEFNNNNDLARKHYRAAYALDPTYKPASENLERVCSFFASKKKHVNFGEDLLEKQEKEKQEKEKQGKDRLKLLEVEIESGYSACGKQIMDLRIPEDVIIGYIVRGNNTIVPNGRTEIREEDTLMIFTNTVSQETVMSGLIGN